MVCSPAIGVCCSRSMLRCCTRAASRPTLAASASRRAHRINVLIFFVWMSYRRATAALICAFDARVSTMKTCEMTRHPGSRAPTPRSSTYSLGVQAVCPGRTRRSIKLQVGARTKAHKGVVVLDLLHGRLRRQRELHDGELVELLG